MHIITKPLNKNRMENGKEPIYPDPMRGAEQSFTNQTPHDLPIGLTKREYFAVHIATGLSVQAIAGRHNIPTEMAENVPYAAVMIADALLAELAKTFKSE
jgi:hypothetical protein